MEIGKWGASPQDKAQYVQALFTSLAGRYDWMTDAWTFGLHRRWKKQAMALAGLASGERVLDVCTGTGDLAKLAQASVGQEGFVVGLDYTLAMLKVGRGRVGRGPRLLCADACHIPLASGLFDLVSFSFGLRNVYDPALALREGRRLLKPGGRLMVLDFNTPAHPALRRLHDAFYNVLVPRLGWAFAWHADAHVYLSDSLAKWPDPAAICGMLENAGLDGVRSFSLLGGVAVVHMGWREGVKNVRKAAVPSQTVTGLNALAVSSPANKGDAPCGHGTHR